MQDSQSGFEPANDDEAVSEPVMSAGDLAHALNISPDALLRRIAKVLREREADDAK